MAIALKNRLPIVLITALLIAAMLLHLPVSAAPSDVSGWSTFEEADRLYHETILEGVVMEKRVAELKTDTSGSDLERASRLHLAGLLQWRHGYVRAALSTLDRAMKLGRYGVVLHRRGQLLEALNRNDEAIASYREALPLLSGVARAETELRMALLIASERGDIEPLLVLAEGGDAAVQNRVAMVLAVLGHAGEAASLYKLPAGASTDRQWRYALRQAEWGLWSQDLEAARAAAWRAVDLAQNEQDSLYALALLTEAYREASALPELVETLENGRDLGVDSRALWVSLLREIGRPEAALAALEGNAEHEPPAVKRQFLGIYRESGRSAGMVAELERLMAVDPEETIWPRGLVEFYLERGDRSAAESVWQGFVERAESGPALLDGAGIMLKLGFDELALTAAERAQQDTVVNLAGADVALDRSARFRFELYLERGRRDEARGVLETLEAATTASDPMRHSIAEAYERLNLPLEARRVMRTLIESDDAAGIEAKQYLAHLLLTSGEAQAAVDLLQAALPNTSASQLRLLHTRLIAAAQAAGIEDELLIDVREKLKDGRATEHETRFLIDMRIRAGDEVEALALIDALYDKAGSDPLEKLRQVAEVRRAAAERMPLDESFRALGSWREGSLPLSKARAYDAVLAELTERDTDNAVFHIRSRIMHYIDSLRFAAEDEQEESDTLMALLDQYIAVSEMGADREFVAGVLALGGQREAAINIYREILAVNPARVDSYLAMGAEFEALERPRQAIGMYQYLLESSGLEEVSWVALDGILNLQSDDLPTLEWTRRIALLRLSASPEQFEYYRQFADLSADLGDNDRQLMALYNGLVAGPELRLPTLRELLRATASTNGGDGTAPDEGGSSLLAQRHVAFGRRLLGLDRVVPPDVYLSLGQAMVEAGDTDAALRAVNQAVEQTGSDELVVQAAALFRQAGDDLSASRLFEQALRNDPDNLDLVVDTAWLQERLGRDERAGALFFDALSTLLALQPLQSEQLFSFTGFTQPGSALFGEELDRLLLDEGRELFPLATGPGRTHGVEYQRYYIPLRNGLVRTLLNDAERRAAMIDSLRDDYASTLSVVRARQSLEPDLNQFPPRPSALPRLAQYPRLQLQAQLLRYLGYTFGDYAAISDLDETLLELFPEDRQLPQILVAHRAEWGSVPLHGPQSTSLQTAVQEQSRGDVSSALAEQAELGLSFVKTVASDFRPSAEMALRAELEIAVGAGDTTAMLRLARQLAETDLIWEALDKVAPHFSAADKKDLAMHVAEILREDSLQARKSLQVEPSPEDRDDLKNWPRSWAARLEDWSGEAVFGQEALLTILSTAARPQAGKSLAFSSSTENLQFDNSLPGVLDVWFVFNALSAVNRDQWIQQLLERSASSQNSSSSLFTLMALLLQVEQDDATAKTLKATLRGYQGVFVPLQLPIYRIDIHPANVPLARELLDIAIEEQASAFQYTAAVFPGPFFEPNLLRCEGRVDAALEAVVDLVVTHYFDNETSLKAASFIGFLPSDLISGNELMLIERFKKESLYSPQAIKDRDLLLVDLHLRNYMRQSLAEADIGPLRSAVFAALETNPEDMDLISLASSIHTLSGARALGLPFMQRQLAYVQEQNPESSQYAELLDAMFRNAFAFDHPLNAVAYRKAVKQTAFAQLYTLTTVPNDNTGSFDTVFKEQDRFDEQRGMVRLWQAVDVSERAALGKNMTIASIGLSDIGEMLVNGDQVGMTVLRENGYSNKPEVESMLFSLQEITGIRSRPGSFVGALSRSGAHQGQPMLAVLAEHPLAVDILEGWVTTVRGRFLPQLSPLIDALAKAHVRNGTAAVRFAELSAALLERRANDKALSLWLAIGSRAAELASSEGADAVLADTVLFDTAHRPSVMLGIARFLAARGDVDGALMRYRSLFRWAQHHGLTIPSTLVTANQFSISAILNSARDVLNAESFERFFREVLEDLKPRDDYLLPAYSEFVLNQIEAGRSEHLYRAFEADVDSALRVLGQGSDDLLRLTQAAIVQYRLNRDPAALDILRKAMEVRAISKRARFLGSSGFGSGQQSVDAGTAANLRSERRRAEEVERYRRMLGLDQHEYTWAKPALAPVVLTIGHPRGDLPGLLFAEADLEWLLQAESRVRTWMDAREIDSDIGIEMLLSLLDVYRDRGADTNLESTFSYVKSQLMNSEVSARTAAAIARKAVELGKSLNDIRLEKELLLKGAIDPEGMVAVLRRIVIAEGEAAALELGDKLLGFTLNDGLIAELIALADANGRVLQAEEWRALREDARPARAELYRTEAIGQLL